MDLVDRDRRIQRIGALALFADGQTGQQALDDRGGLRPDLGAEGKRVGLGMDGSIRPEDLELVQIALAHLRHEDFPDAALVAQPHHVAAAVPLVEVADHRHPACARRPDGEARAGHAVHGVQVCAEPLVGAVVRAFGEQVDVGFGDQRGEAVRVFQLGRVGRLAVMGTPLHAQAVGERVAAARHGAGEQVAVALPGQLAQAAAQRVQQLDLVRSRQQRAHHQRRAGVVHAEHGKRITMVCAHQRGQRVGIDAADVGRLHRLGSLGGGLAGGGLCCRSLARHGSVLGARRL